MIGGKILEFSSNGDVVTFNVKEEHSESRCSVKASLNSHAQRLIEVGADVWWDSETVYLTIGDVPDCKFKKIGYSY